MKSFATLALLASGLSGAHAALAPPCKNCRQDECMDFTDAYVHQLTRPAIIQEDCGDYLIVVETPSSELEVATTTVTVIPTETFRVTVPSSTVLGIVITTIPVTATATVNYYVTEPFSVTDTVTEAETYTVTETSAVISRRFADDEDYAIPHYASACTDVYEYSSACSCVGFVPSTSTAPAPMSTSTVTEITTPYTVTMTTTVQEGAVTPDPEVISVTMMGATVTQSNILGTDTVVTTVATTTVTETFYTTTTVAPPAAPTVTAYLSVGNGQYLDASLSQDYQDAAPLFIASTTSPTRFVLNGADGSIDVDSGPAPTFQYTLWLVDYGVRVSYKEVGVLTQSSAEGSGISEKLSCGLDSSDQLTCRSSLDSAEMSELWICNNYPIFIPKPGRAPSESCAAPRRLTVTAVRA
ncbi:uncharacterized protein F5Z01DRAFT_751546 [Emericellopsis atlantica]|uniref:Uncharacterized protein n=1 Tax=Emericellopsis atlantica TaxID=2614577 RepID=A0A9P8CNJ2_9HYPO|nr:uncharacterized protein F5Z01DRAFT_751546 [Emericellopsis atlantica]KAG9253125.1 hypothetical protein F5Z01DRAFT_751546 [Emericellopsis atlantica]